MRPARSLAAALCVVVLTLGACGLTDSGAKMSEGVSGPTSSTQPDDDPADAVDPPPVDLDLAVSEPREDSVYPEIGDPSVDALHYDLTLDWDPETDTLSGEEVLTFRSTGTAEQFQLDFGEPLEITSATLDGRDVQVTHDGKDLVVAAPVKQDQRYELALSYTGTPEPVEGPTTRPDLRTVGFHIDPDHETWTIQEPRGAFTWYAVNDQPADKALYDFTLTVPSPWVGIANGEQTSSDDDGEITTTTYHLAEPAASYLTTLAFGDYDKTEDESETGTPLTYWIPKSDPQWLAGPSTSPEAIAWIEEYLGPYPFDTGGILVVDSESGMETQTMITLGDTDYSTSPATVVHEFVHQWYGDQVTPNDWRDVWMNEGMAMYLQLIWEAEQAGVPVDVVIDDYAPYEAEERATAGPPGDYNPGMFGSSNIYLGPAFMWHELRLKVGDDDEFWGIVRGWPEAQDNTSSNREALYAYWEKETGRELSEFFDDWILGTTTPARS
jgi:aminopeptidase N